MIDILMAVYNGESYISAQIDSIISQSVSNWRLIILDDASKDNTLEILKRYEETHPEQIIVHQNETNSGSAQENFYNLLKYIKHNYVMFCDHDDIWEEQKIEKTYRRMLELEAIVENPKTPLLVHTDLKVVDKNLEVINPSMFKLQNLDSKATRLNQLLVQNIVTGCTVMVNMSLISKMGITPKNSIMHDWWFALIATSFGAISFIEEPTILYRQHSNNQVGAKDVSSFAYKLGRLINKNETKKNISQTYVQAEEFLSKYKESLYEEQIKVLEAYVGIKDKPKLDKIKTLFEYKFFKHGIARKLGQILFI
jgi:glycosyltransferase involved in cell wall biosynthesis